MASTPVPLIVPSGAITVCGLGSDVVRRVTPLAAAHMIPPRSLISESMQVAIGATRVAVPACGFTYTFRPAVSERRKSKAFAALRSIGMFTRPTPPKSAALTNSVNGALCPRAITLEVERRLARCSKKSSPSGAIRVLVMNPAGPRFDSSLPGVQRITP
jgi:hypothetical protein